MKKLIKSDLAQAEHAVDFDVPIYNVWKQQMKTSGLSHFGNSEVRRWTIYASIMSSNAIKVICSTRFTVISSSEYCRVNGVLVLT